jgi:VWFA-related protein
MRWIAGLVLTAVTAAASIVVAQDQEARFRTEVDLVALNVVAIDSQGRPVKELSRADFAVFEDGQPQEISVFAVVPAPIDLALLLDTSASMTDKISTVQQAAIGFTSIVRLGDRIAIVDIKDAVKILHPLNEDVAAARQAIASTYPRGNTSLYNGLYMTLKEMMKQRPADGELRRQAIVVLSDGNDTSSLVSLDDLMDLAKQAGVAVHDYVAAELLCASCEQRKSVRRGDVCDEGAAARDWRKGVLSGVDSATRRHVQCDC